MQRACQVHRSIHMSIAKQIVVSGAKSFLFFVWPFSTPSSHDDCPSRHALFYVKERHENPVQFPTEKEQRLFSLSSCMF